MSKGRRLSRPGLYYEHKRFDHLEEAICNYKDGEGNTYDTYKTYMDLMSDLSDSECCGIKSLILENEYAKIG